MNKKFSQDFIRKPERIPKIYVTIDSQPEYITAGQLHKHQITGLDFLAYSMNLKSNVVLADEMGLGKSALIWSFINYLMNSCSISRPFLIVVPLSKMQRWMDELK